VGGSLFCGLRHSKVWARPSRVLARQGIEFLRKRHIKHFKTGRTRAWLDPAQTRADRLSGGIGQSTKQQRPRVRQSKAWARQSRDQARQSRARGLQCRGKAVHLDNNRSQRGWAKVYGDCTGASGTALLRKSVKHGLVAAKQGLGAATHRTLKRKA